ncbi:hypothetical protein CFP56_037321 [Quercus suber]|uniref:Uncharacterized protein n=1 Tax=Quercus suber TaxID=58331 RepID=A0AAW0J687_QUESU
MPLSPPCLPHLTLIGKIRDFCCVFQYPPRSEQSLLNSYSYIDNLLTLIDKSKEKTLLSSLNVTIFLSVMLVRMVEFCVTIDVILGFRSLIC